MRLLLKRILAHFPTPLPVGMTALEAYCQDIIELSGRFADEDSLKFTIASMIIHAGEAKGYLPKRYFVLRLRKVAANQVASQLFQDIKVRQAEAAALARQQAEDAAKQTAASDVTEPSGT